MIPLRDVIPSRTTPYITISLVVINVLVFLYQLSLGGDINNFVFTYGLVPADFSWISVLTSMFLHGGFLHVAGNMLYLWIFGDNVEDRVGHGRFILFYLACGIAAALGASRAPKIFVGNMLECSETVGLSLNHMLEELCRHGCPTHVLANRSPMPLQRSVGGRRYIALDEGDALLRQRSLQIVSEDFEDPWQRGVHDAGLVAAAIARLSGG